MQRNSRRKRHAKIYNQITLRPRLATLRIVNSQNEMCVRYALTCPPETVRACFGYDERPEFPPRSDITPTQPIAIVTAREFTQGEQRNFRLVRWGFLPSWVEDPEKFPLIANARAESVLDKPSFSAAFKRRRCLAPADGFYARRTAGGGRRGESLLIRARDGAPFGLAGLYETYLDPNGSEIDTACILTTRANALIADVSERMPVIVPREAFSAWLNHETTPQGAALALLSPAPETLLSLSPASDGRDTIR